MNTLRNLVRIIVFLAFLVSATIVPFSANTVKAQSPELVSVNIDIPDQAIYGNHPLRPAITLANNTAEIQHFDSQIWVGGKAWYGGMSGYEYPVGTEYYWNECNQLGCTISWRGDIPANGSVTFAFTTSTGTYAGTFELIKVTLTQPQELSTSKSITLTEGTGDLRGMLVFEEIGYRYYKLTLTAEYPTLTQFRVATINFCGQTQSGFQSYYLLTYQQYSWYAMNLPEGSCTINLNLRAVQSGKEVALSTTVDIVVTPRIDYAGPYGRGIGEEIEVYGDGFGQPTEENNTMFAVEFYDNHAEFQCSVVAQNAESWTPNKIVFKLPSCLNNREFYQIAVLTSSGQRNVNAYPIGYLAGPHLSLSAPENVELMTNSGVVDLSIYATNDGDRDAHITYGYGVTSGMSVTITGGDNPIEIHQTSKWVASIDTTNLQPGEYDLTFTVEAWFDDVLLEHESTNIHLLIVPYPTFIPYMGFWPTYLNFDLQPNDRFQGQTVTYSPPTVSGGKWTTDFQFDTKCIGFSWTPEGPLDGERFEDIIGVGRTLTSGCDNGLDTTYNGTLVIKLLDKNGEALPFYYYGDLFTELEIPTQVNVSSQLTYKQYIPITMH